MEIGPAIFKVKFPDGSFKDIEVAIYKCDVFNYKLISLYNERIYKTLLCMYFHPMGIISSVENIGIFDDKNDCFDLYYRSNPSDKLCIWFKLRYDPDTQDKIKKYIRENGLFETRQLYVLK